MELIFSQSDRKLAKGVATKPTGIKYNKVYVSEKEMVTTDGFMCVRTPISWQHKDEKLIGEIAISPKLIETTPLAGTSKKACMLAIDLEKKVAVIETKCGTLASPVAYDEKAMVFGKLAKVGQKDAQGEPADPNIKPVILSLSLEVLRRLLNCLPANGPNNSPFISFGIIPNVKGYTDSPIEFSCGETYGMVMPMLVGKDIKRYQELAQDSYVTLDDAVRENYNFTPAYPGIEFGRLRLPQFLSEKEVRTNIHQIHQESK